MHISYHCGPGGNHTGLGAFMESMMNADFRLWLKTADHYGHLFDSINRGGQAVYRLSTRGQDDGFDYDVLPYHISNPVVAAAVQWSQIKSKLPPEFHPSTWIEVCNEVDKERADWIGDVLTEISILANADGYRICGPGWASGEPEPEAWETAGMLRYLRRCADHPIMNSVSLHEYNYGNAPFADVYPHHVGRFQYLFDACDRHNIQRPAVHISEWGFAYDHVPPWSEIRDYITEAFELYALYGEIQGAALWALNVFNGSNHLANTAQQTMNPLFNLQSALGARDAQLGNPLDPDIFPPSSKSLEQRLFEFGMAQKSIDTNADAALQKAIGSDGYLQTGNEKWTTQPEGQFATQPAYNAQSDEDRVYWARVGDWSNVNHTTGNDEPPASSEPLAGIVLGPLLGKPHVLTDPFDAPREYANGKHEGIDADLIGGPIDSPEPVLAAYPGVVVRIGRSEGAYYNFVVIRHVAGSEAAVPGTPFETWYAHMDTVPFVAVGQRVERGTPLGELGDTGGKWAEHVHFNLTREGGLSGYAVANVIDPLPFMTFDVPSPPPPSGDHDALEYLGARRADAHMLELSWGGQEKIRVLSDSATKFRHVKNSNWEAFEVNGSYIYRTVDTSPGPVDGVDRYYWLRDAGSNRSEWMPRYMSVGQWFYREPIVSFYRRDNCQPFHAPYTDPSWLQLVAIHSQYRFALTGVIVDDVMELAWSRTRGGPIIERYWYAGGLVGWLRTADGWNSAIASIAAPDNQPMVIPCLDY